MAHVLAIVGSPRTGHTQALVERIGEMLRAHGDRLELVLLRDLDLEPCTGCYTCQSTSEKLCPRKDALLPLVQRMREADGVIFASPTYVGNVSALMKRLMERMAWTAHRPQFLHKPAMLVTTASSATGGTLRAMRWFRWPGFDIVAEIGWSVWPSPRVDWRPSAAREARLAKDVARFHAAMARPRTSLSLARVVQFYLSKSTPMSDPRFFRADDLYHRDIDALGFAVAPWKKRVGEAVLGVSSAWLARGLGPRAKRPT